MATEAELGVMQPQAKDYPEPPEAGRALEGPSPRAFRGSKVLLAPCSQTSGPKWQEDNFLLFKATHLVVLC